MQGEGAARLGGEGLLHAGLCSGSPRRTQGTRLAVIMTLKAWGSLLPDPRPAGLQLGVWAGG